LVKAFTTSLGAVDAHVIIKALYALYRAVKANAVREASGQLPYIFARTTADGAPLRSIIDRQHAVVVKKPDKAVSREVEHAHRVSRPDGCTHRHDVPIDELACIAV